MKKIAIVLVLAAMAHGAQAQEKVYPYSRVQNPPQWYVDQAAAWKKMLDKNPQDANAWYNYYYATRLALRFNPAEKRTDAEKQVVFNGIVADMEKNVPGTYEYNMVKWLVGGSNMEFFPYLEKAKALAPARTEHLDGFINSAEIDRDRKQRDLYSKKKFEASELSEGMMNYNYNMLAGLEHGAILITAGDNDTYPAWALQSLGIRKDLHVINIYLLQIDTYREKLFKELGIEPWEKLWRADITPEGATAAVDRFFKGIVKHMAENKKGTPLYVSNTASFIVDKAEPPMEQDMYLTGLAIRYSKQSMDNMALLKRNFEQEYMLDYLDKSFHVDISAELVKQINVNYVVPMLKLYDHYKASGDVQHTAWIENKLRSVSKGTQAEEDVNKHLAAQ